MKPRIRLATAADHEFIASWTERTFAWGDYVADRLEEWLDEPVSQSATFVAEAAGRAIALGRVRLLSDSEAWASAMRVHPEHRRTGIGSAVGDALWDWARTAGAQVIRLAVEDWNEPARAQVVKAGFRPLGAWYAARRGVGESSPVPEGNGGVRVRGAEALKPAHSAEAEPALLSWSSGELARAGRGLFARHWIWQRLSREHLTEAARSRSLWEGRPGWAIAETEGDAFLVHWLETTGDDVRAMVRALVERAADSGASAIRVTVPAVPWLIQALRRSRFEMNGLQVFGRSL